MLSPHFVVAAVCFLDAESRVLTVRKRDTHAFMLPGGKLEPGASVTATVYTATLPVPPVAAREIAELRWLHPVAGAPVAPLLRDHVFPALLTG